MRTWAKRGQTPVLTFNFNYEVLSAIAGMTFWNFYFQLFPNSVRSPQVIEFLGHLKRYLRRPVLVIWDRSPPIEPNDAAVDRGAEGLDANRVSAGLCAELNPVEYLWGYWKQHEPPNVSPRDYWELDDPARRALKRIRRRPRILAACWQQSCLAFS